MRVSEAEVTGKAGRGLWWRVGWVLLGVVVVCAAGVEGYLRWGVGLGDPPLWMSDPGTEYKLVPGQDCWRWGNHFVVNDLGMRAGPFSRTRSVADVLRVVIVGDSVVNGGTLLDQDDLVSEMLRRRLEAVTDRPVEVGNVSAGSWGPENMAAAFKQMDLEGLDVVIVVVSSHDLTDVPTFAPLSERDHPSVKPWSATGEALVRYGPPLWRYLTNQRRVGEASDSIYRPAIDMVAAERSLEALRSLYEEARRTGAQAVMLVHPTAEELSNGRLHANGRAMLAEAGDLGVRGVDGVAYLTEAAKTHKLAYRDIIHPGPGTNEAYAALFEGLVVELAGPEDEAGD